MAECSSQLALDFHPTCPLTVAFDAPHISSEGGALLLRQMDDRWGLSEEPRSKLRGIHQNNSNCNGCLCNCL